MKQRFAEQNKQRFHSACFGRVRGCVTARMPPIDMGTHERPRPMAEITQEQRQKIAEQFIKALPFCAALDIRLESMGVAEASMSMPYDKRIVGDPETGVVHGGAVSALMDTCCGLAVSLHPDSAKPTATIDLRIEYMRPAKVGERIVTEAHVYNATRTVAFVRAFAHDGNPDKPVASATGAFTFSRIKKDKS